jgi:hypothetical protein
MRCGSRWGPNRAGSRRIEVTGAIEKPAGRLQAAVRGAHRYCRGVLRSASDRERFGKKMDRPSRREFAEPSRQRTVAATMSRSSPSEAPRASAGPKMRPSGLLPASGPATVYRIRNHNRMCRRNRRALRSRQRPDRRRSNSNRPRSNWSAQRRSRTRSRRKAPPEMASRPVVVPLHTRSRPTIRSPGAAATRALQRRRSVDGEAGVTPVVLQSVNSNSISLYCTPRASIGKMAIAVGGPPPGWRRLRKSVGPSGLRRPAHPSVRGPARC